ncbi:MAG TPA: hypothetical protein VF631_02105 [Allosphingosinicella sp.]|uniref:hypothetical protein n=1 Tax=Allosphingosinicella sp. TaxID=2823234 RepID=UPI002F293CD6
MRYYEDVPVGETLVFGEHRVGLAETAEFARAYDPRHLPDPGTAYAVGGPAASPWYACAIAAKLVADYAATEPMVGIDFVQHVRALKWHQEVRVGDLLRVEVEILNLLRYPSRDRQKGWALVRLVLISRGPQGFGQWGDDEWEEVESPALSYLTTMGVPRRTEAQQLWTVQEHEALRAADGKVIDAALRRELHLEQADPSTAQNIEVQSATMAAEPPPPAAASPSTTSRGLLKRLFGGE